MRSPGNRLCGFLGGGMDEASGSGRAKSHAEPQRGVPHSVLPAVARRVRRRFSVSKLRPISRPLETGFISLKLSDAGGPIVRDQRSAPVTNLSRARSRKA